MRGLTTLQGYKQKHQSNKKHQTLQHNKLSNISNMKDNPFLTKNNPIPLYAQLNNLKNNIILNNNNIGLYCVYHINEKITNFCKNTNCLLPLCPQCIKIHTEQHQKIGIFGQFETINICLEQSISGQMQTISQLEQVLRITQNMTKVHENQAINNKNQLLKAKQQMIQYINQVFLYYQQQIQSLLAFQYQSYSQQLISLYTQLYSLTQTQKLLYKKSQSSHLQLQFLIDYYSKQPNFHQIIQNYSNKIQSLKPNYLQLSINTYQLQRIKVIIKKYLDFGEEYNKKINQKIQKNINYQKITLLQRKQKQLKYNNINYDYIDNIHQNLDYINSNKQFRSPIKKLYNEIDQGQYNYTNKYLTIDKGQIAKIISDKIHRQSILDHFQSPLEQYSLQKSRKYRA